MEESTAKGFERCFGLSLRSVRYLLREGITTNEALDRDNNSTMGPEKLSPVNMKRLSGLE